MNLFQEISIQSISSNEKPDILSKSNSDIIRNAFNNCRLCWAISNLGQKYISNKILLSTQNYLIIPALGALIPGYLLLLSKAHWRAVATLEEKYLCDLEAQLSILLGQLIKMNPEWIIFEQGSTKDYGIKGCCIEHMHLHFLPLKFDLANKLSKMLSVPLESISSLNDIRTKCNEYPCNYIFVRNPNGDKFILRPEVYPSQYVRQIIASHLNKDLLWDWKYHFHEDNNILTIDALTKAKLYSNENS